MNDPFVKILIVVFFNIAVLASIFITNTAPEWMWIAILGLTLLAAILSLLKTKRTAIVMMLELVILGGLIVLGVKVNINLSQTLALIAFYIGNRWVMSPKPATTV